MQWVATHCDLEPGCDLGSVPREPKVAACVGPVYAPLTDDSAWEHWIRDWLEHHHRLGVSEAFLYTFRMVLEGDDFGKYEDPRPRWAREALSPLPIPTHFVGLKYMENATTLRSEIRHPSGLIGRGHTTKYAMNMQPYILADCPHRAAALGFDFVLAIDLDEALHMNRSRWSSVVSLALAHNLGTIVDVLTFGSVPSATVACERQQSRYHTVNGVPEPTTQHGVGRTRCIPCDAAPPQIGDIECTAGRNCPDSVRLLCPTFLGRRKVLSYLNANHMLRADI